MASAALTVLEHSDSHALCVEATDYDDLRQRVADLEQEVNAQEAKNAALERVLGQQPDEATVERVAKAIFEEHDRTEWPNDKLEAWEDWKDGPDGPNFRRIALAALRGAQGHTKQGGGRA
ncbi:MAG: hypothetical protein ACRD3C_12425 [Vicinamibacterales bacterium]